jgi:hypothetical protein
LITVLWNEGGSAWIAGHTAHGGVLHWLAERDAIFAALLASLVCLFIVSMLTAAPRREQLAPFFADESGPEPSKA